MYLLVRIEMCFQISNGLRGDRRNVFGELKSQIKNPQFPTSQNEHEQGSMSQIFRLCFQFPIFRKLIRYSIVIYR